MAEIRSWLTDASLNLEQDDAFDVRELVERLADLVEGGDLPFSYPKERARRSKPSS